jgi:hypothetical protein
MMLAIKRELLEEVTEMNTKTNIKSMIENIELNLQVDFNYQVEERIHTVTFLSKIAMGIWKESNKKTRKCFQIYLRDRKERFRKNLNKNIIQR